MAAPVLIQNPVFEALALIQAGLDEFPNLGVDSDFLTCRSLTKSSKRCGIKTNPKASAEVDRLFSEFKGVTECPETDTFYEDMGLFVVSTHCFKHRDAVLKAFENWRDSRTAAASSPPPATPTKYSTESPAESPASSVDAIFSPAISQSSDETFYTPLSYASVCGEPVSFAEPENKDEHPTQSISTRAGQDEEDSPIDVPIQVRDERIDETGHPGKPLEFPDLGFCNPRRALSARSYAVVLGVIQDHPRNHAMKKGIVYVLENLNEPNLFKIGYTGDDDAKARLKHKCWRETAKIVHETETKFRGARHAERIIHTELQNHNIGLKKCRKCGNGHREWFYGPREAIFDTITKIECFVQLPAYIRQGGEWKLSDKAHKLAATMYMPGARNWRDILREGIATGRPLDVIPETAPQKTTPEMPTKAMVEAPGPRLRPTAVRVEAIVGEATDVRVNVQVTVERMSASQGEADEARIMEIPHRPKPKQVGGSIRARSGRVANGLSRRG
ncbi:hypothetical protein J3F83DRAFT_194284 [Trichoderma novae-zelandiae]